VDTAFVIQLTFSYLAVFASAADTPCSSSAILFLVVTPVLLLLLAEESPNASPPAKEGIGGVEVLALRTETALGKWS
jgi:hypothetical protein